MELIMPKEELRDIKVKIVFWFWFGLIISILATPLCLIFGISLFKIHPSIGSMMCLAIYFLPILSIIMFFARLSKWFIEREN